jgi:hypothetical protein
MLQAVPTPLAESKLSGRTLRKHRNNLWLLGGKMIADLRTD